MENYSLTVDPLMATSNSLAATQNGYTSFLQSGLNFVKVETPEQPPPSLAKPKRKRLPKGERKPRVPNPDEWKRNVIKKNRLSGKEYVSYSGEVVPAKAIGPDCKCKMKCFTEDRQPIFDQIFKEFYELTSKEIQDTYLCGLIHCYGVERRRAKTGEGTPRSANFKYYLKVPNHFFQVCKAAFKSVHAITGGRIERLTKALTHNITAPVDKRGKHQNRPKKITEEIIQQVHSHIKSFIQPGQKFMPEDLNMAKMHKYFLEVYQPDILHRQQQGEQVKPKVSLDFYRNYYKKHFNIPFGNPKAKADLKSV